MKKPVTLIIMDGYGLSEETHGSAIAAASTPALDEFFAKNPHTQLDASGEEVGLPAGQIGNSEVGHTNIGAGRIVYQDLTRITRDIRLGGFFENPAYNGAIDNCLKKGSALHIMGLMSPGGVHSHTDHLFALLELCARRGFKAVYIHCFTDGRDVPPKSAKEYIADIVKRAEDIGVGTVATVCGRFYAMDRDKRWERLELAYNMLVCGEGEFEPDPVKAVQTSYDAGVTDEFIKPVVCCRDGVIHSGDSMVLRTFLPDRAWETTRVLVDPEFNFFPRRYGYFPVHFVCTSQYDESMPNVTVAYPPQSLKNTLGDVINATGKTQLRIAETEKYAHVTFFFNGGVETVSEGEDRILIDSPKQFATYDLIPEMSAYPLTRKAVAAVKSGKYDLIVLNFANCDMVGHTGVFDAAVKAVAAVDKCVGEVVRATVDCGGIALITADHGNAEEMTEPDGVTPHTAHSTNPVPFIVVGRDVKLHHGKLCDIAPTILTLMGIEKPEEMTGESLIDA